MGNGRGGSLPLFSFNGRVVVEYPQAFERALIGVPLGGLISLILMRRALKQEQG